MKSRAAVGSLARRAVLGCLVVSSALVLVGCQAPNPTDRSTSGSATAPATPASKEAAEVDQLARAAMEEFHLRALLVQVTVDGQDVLTAAYGESMTGVPASTDMHFRNGAFAFTYISTAVGRLVDEGKLSLDDPVSRWLPDLPNAERVTVRNLLNMTSGYADYVYQPAFGDALYRDPFRHWTNAELIEIGVSAPTYFEPGTNFGYSHTNYVILGEILEKVTGTPLAQVLQELVLDPMGLTQTSDNGGTAAVPQPALHSFSSERRESLGIPATTPFTEESTYWDPSWTTANGAVQTTTLGDLTRSMAVVGTGELLSKAMFEAQTGPSQVGFGTADPTGRCPVCVTNTEDRNYGLGLVRNGAWITQTKNFAGSGATGGYLADGRVAVSVVTTYLPAAFDEQGQYQNASSTVFKRLAGAMAPAHAPK